MLFPAYVVMVWAMTYDLPKVSSKQIKIEMRKIFDAIRCNYSFKKGGGNKKLFKEKFNPVWVAASPCRNFCMYVCAHLRKNDP